MHHTRKRHSAVGLGCLLAALPLWGQNMPLPAAPAPLSALPQPGKPAGAPATAPELQLSRQIHPSQTGSLRLQTSHIAIAGVQSLPFEQIAALFQPLSGKEITLEQLVQATTQATQLYQQAGYPLSFVYLPEQTFQNGVVQVIAVEGHTSAVVLAGDTGKSAPLLEAMAQPLLEEKPLRQSTFERQTLLMSRMDNLKVVASAALPTTLDGATPLQLQIDRDPILFNVGADLAQGDSKALGTLTLNDPLWGGSQWQISSILDKPSHERFVSANMRQWLNAQGTQLRLSYSDFKGQDNFGNISLDDITHQRRLELNVTHPLHLSNTSSSVLGASLFGVNYEKTYRFTDADLEIHDHEKVRALQLQWTGHLTQQRTQHNASLSFTQGLDGLGADTKRSNNLNLPMLENPAKMDFSRLSADYSLRHRWENLIGIGLGLGGQYSPHTLPVSERVSFGAARYARGYRSGEASGDRGLGVSLELNRIIARPEGQRLKTIEPYLLYEEAKTWFDQSGIPGQHLKSSSVGLRLSDSRHYAIDLSVSKPLGDPSPYNPERKLRYSMTLTYQFGQ